ncbi:MAG: transketolase [Candidatus Cloacimonetes bacterium]|nr:transketolase [Candidatus Cloacimonadota bacterium]
MPINTAFKLKYDSITLPENILALKAQAIAARTAILKMTSLAGSGHPGGSLSTIDLLLSLYSVIEHDPRNPSKPDRDKIVISHGHVSPAAYTALSLNGYFELNQMISEFRLAGSIYEGHVEPCVPGIEWASGNLGQGLSAGCGFALANKIKGYDNHVYVLMGDGEQQKGQISEARRFASKFQLNNLTAFVDYNKLQISGTCDSVMPQDIKAEFLADKWQVLEIDGHDLLQILAAIKSSRNNAVPTLILAHTVMGKGISFMENDEKWHGQTLPYKAENGCDLVSALAELNQPDDFLHLQELRAKFTSGKCSLPHTTNPDLPVISGKHINYEQKTDNRSAWGNALVDIAEHNNTGEFLPLAVFDCDLAGSVKTAGFREKYPQNFFQSGIMEHHTVTCAGAFSQAGFQTFFSDFGVFGIDETYNQQRLNDINDTNLKIILTHVGIDVGEDGKTHQCVDYLGQVRNMFNFKCLIPADPNQTDHIIRWLAAKNGNYLVPMGRSKLDIIRTPEGDIFYGDDYVFEYGKADLLRDGDTAALFVMGTLTNKALKIAGLLKQQNINLQVWNVSTPQQINPEVVKQAAATGYIFTYEDHNVHTGLASCLQAELVNLQLAVKFKAFGVQNYPVSGNSDAVYQYCWLDPETVSSEIIDIIKG